MLEHASAAEKIGIIATLIGGAVGLVAGIIRAARWVARVEAQIELARAERAEFIEEIRGLRQDLRDLRGDFNAVVLRWLPKE